VTTAWAASTIAELSRDRFRLGIGAMPEQWNEEWHDISYERPVDRMRDFVTALRAAWSARPGQPARHEGPFYRIGGYERFGDVQEWRIPVYLGVTRPRMSRLAGEVADGVILNSVHTVRWIEDVNWPELREGLAVSGRDRADLDVGVRVYCAISGDEAEAVDMLRRSLAFFLPVPYMHDLLRHAGFERDLELGLAALADGDRAGMEEAFSDEAVRTFAIAGRPEQVREQLRRYDGLVDWILFSGPRGYPPEEYREQMERIIATFST
jgi:alkanesulfonate monooxygenase SsuD/methylene tetrahydromethanopterin reductase-like flavin-dependent oxidoreductase (luciferase family)